MLRTLTLLGGMLAAPAATAATCTFTTECYETEACVETAFSITVDMPRRMLVTDYGDLPIVYAEARADSQVMLGTGRFGDHLLTVYRDGARLAVHFDAEPVAITYAGACEGFY